MVPGKFPRGSPDGKGQRMAKRKNKLTKRFVDALTPDPGGRDVIHFDSEMPRYGVRVRPTGTKTYILRYRTKFGQPRSYTIGPAGPGGLEPAKARASAIKLKAQISDGADPSADRRADRHALTVAELCEQYQEASKTRLKPSTHKNNQSMINAHVLHLLGSKPVASLTPSDIEKFYKGVIAGKTARRGSRASGGLGAAERTLDMLRAILQRAVRDGAIAQNPVRGIDRPKPKKQNPPFSFENVTAVGRALRELEAEGENVIGLRCIRFLILTGCRRMEAQTLTWDMVDGTARCLRLPDTKSGPQTRPLGRAAIRLLQEHLLKSASPTYYVFPGQKQGGIYTNLPNCWARVAKRAEIKGVTPHGLRHWFASAAAEMNYSELTIAGLLGHRIASVTARYATAPDSAFIAAADRVSLRLADALDGIETSGKVLSIGAA